MNVAQYLIAAARSFAYPPALSFGGTLVRRYGEFADRVARVAAGLRSTPGIVPGDRVAIAMKNRPEYLEAMYAAWHAGLCVVPINAKLHVKEFAYIYPREVEEALLLHPSVQEASVVGRRHADRGEEVVACVVAGAGCTIDEAELDRICLDNIARFKQPKAYVVLDMLPKNSCGKVLKTELRAMSPASLPERGRGRFV